MGMGTRLVVGALLGVIAFTIGGTIGGVFGAALMPTTWRGRSQIVVDWNQMPIETTGDERGLVGWFMREITSNGAPALRDTFARDASVQSRLGLSEQYLRSATEVRSSRESKGTLVRIEVIACDADQVRCGAIERAATEHVKDLFQNYGLLEGFGQFLVKSREAEQQRDDTIGWKAFWSLVVAQPVRVTVEPVRRDWRRPLVAGVMLGGLLGFVAMASTVLVFALVTNRPATPRNTPPPSAPPTP
jgi:hypothetical protein